MENRGRPHKRLDPVITTVTLERDLMLTLKAYCAAKSEALGMQYSMSDAIADLIPALSGYVLISVHDLARLTRVSESSQCEVADAMSIAIDLAVERYCA